VRFPLRRQQDAELAAVPESPSPAPGPIPFPPPASAPIDPHAGTWDELQRGRPQGGNLRLRGQLTSSDARAERLVRQVRTEVAALQETLSALAQEQDEMLEVDPASVAKNPEAALTLPPAVLVRAVVSAESENRRLRKRARKVQERQRQMAARLQELQLSEAARAARLQTLEDVISALHNNLGDLRHEREFLRQWAPPKLSRPGELPSGEDLR
jgi:type I site-specific restriction endonuclease